MESEHIGQGIKDKLQKEHAQLNPMIMKIEIDRLRDVLYETQKKFGGQNTEKSPENSNKLR